MWKQKIPPLTYDKERINKEIPIQEVIAIYRPDINLSHGNSRNIRCPSPNHPDKKPSAHIYPHTNNCKCFACGGNFTPLSLAGECLGLTAPKDFPEVCKRVIEDTGRSVYDYSNLSEIESIKRSIQSGSPQKYYDYFPISNNDLETIGLHNPTFKEQAEHYYVAAEDYYKFYNDGTVPAHISTKDENGRDIMFELDRYEAIDMELIMPDEYDNDRTKERPPSHKMSTIQDLWKEDKSGVEDMLIGKCHETMDKMESAIAQAESIVESYKSTLTLNQQKEAVLLQKAYINALSSGKNVVLTEAQQATLDSFYTAREAHSSISMYQERFNEAKTVLKKIQKHQEERKKAETQLKNKSNWKSR